MIYFSFYLLIIIIIIICFLPDYDFVFLILGSSRHCQEPPD